MTFAEANLGFLLDYGDGTSKAEIESELYRLAFQKRGENHYDRDQGASFEDMEQQPDNPVVYLLTTKNMIESIYRLNEEREFDPYIVVGFSDIEIVRDDVGKPRVKIYYRLLQDLALTGLVERGF